MWEHIDHLFFDSKTFAHHEWAHVLQPNLTSPLKLKFHLETIYYGVGFMLGTMIYTPDTTISRFTPCVPISSKTNETVHKHYFTYLSAVLFNFRHTWPFFNIFSNGET